MSSSSTPSILGLNIKLGSASTLPWIRSRSAAFWIRFLGLPWWRGSCTAVEAASPFLCRGEVTVLSGSLQPSPFPITSFVEWKLALRLLHFQVSATPQFEIPALPSQFGRRLFGRSFFGSCASLQPKCFSEEKQSFAAALSRLNGKNNSRRSLI